MTSLGDTFWGALVEDAAGAGFEASQDRGGSSVPPVDHRLAGSHTPSGTLRWWQSPWQLAHRGEAAPTASVPPKPLAAVACVRLGGTQLLE